MERWLALKAVLPPNFKNGYLFFTSGRGPSKNLNAQMQAVWVKMGLSKVPTFTTLRSSLTCLVSTR